MVACGIVALKMQTFGPKMATLAPGQSDAAGGGDGSATAVLAGAEMDVKPAVTNAAANKMDGWRNRRGRLARSVPGKGRGTLAFGIWLPPCGDHFGFCDHFSSRPAPRHLGGERSDPLPRRPGPTLDLWPQAGKGFTLRYFLTDALKKGPNYRSRPPSHSLWWTGPRPDLFHEHFSASWAAIGWSSAHRPGVTSDQSQGMLQRASSTPRRGR